MREGCVCVCEGGGGTGVCVTRCALFTTAHEETD